MKAERIPKPALAFALIFVLNAMPISAETNLDTSGSKADMWFDCWNCPYQCHGDADCQAQGSMITKYRVFTNDLEIIYAVYMASYTGYGHWPARYPQDLNYNPCADFDRDFDVDDQDLAILENWHRRTDVPPDCPGRPLELLPMDPNALIAGSTYTIEWTDVPSSCPYRYKLTYSIDNGENWLLMEPNEVFGMCSFDWIVPTVDSNQCLLSIEDPIPFIYDTGLFVIGDTSDEPFIIYECPATLTGDLNADCYINFRDLNVLGLNWHIEPSFQTLATLAEQWCDCGNPYDPACSY
ncbi:MAG: hypothetical protein JXN61_03980 [Sedimentisphaerales bacterium]|nr:hypothetical protein [Sedimentisphaerales bacterium]